MTGLTIRQYNEWTNSNHKENPNSTRDLRFNHCGLVIAIEVFRSESFQHFPGEGSTFSKASSSSEEKNSRRHDCNRQGGQQHLIRQKVLFEECQLSSYVPSAVSSSADSPSQSWSGKKISFNLSNLVNWLRFHLKVKVKKKVESFKTKAERHKMQGNVSYI